MLTARLLGRFAQLATVALCLLASLWTATRAASADDLGAEALFTGICLFGLAGLWAIARSPRETVPSEEDASPSVPVPLGRLDVDLLYDVAHDLLFGQLDSLNAIDSKIGIIFSIGSAEIAAAAAVLALHQGVPNGGLLLVVVAATYTVMAGVSIRALATRDWSTGIEIEPLARRYAVDGKSTVKLGAATSMVVAYEQNSPAATDKREAFGIVLLALSLQTGVLLLAAVFVEATA